MHGHQNVKNIDGHLDRVQVELQHITAEQLHWQRIMLSSFN